MFWKKKNAPSSQSPEDDVRITEMHLEGGYIHVTAVYKEKVYYESTYLSDYEGTPEKVLEGNVHYLKTVVVYKERRQQWWDKAQDTVDSYPVATR